MQDDGEPVQWRTFLDKTLGGLLVMIYGSIEAGGTKFVCAVSDDTFEILDQESFPTTVPEETMAQVIRFFEKYQEGLQGIGVGSFGPIDLHPESPTYGFITSTPKTAWQNFDFVGALKAVFSLPVAWTTDVNAACYGEYTAGHGSGCNNVVYYTVGTGIGGGAVQNGVFVEGFSHPEMGHMMVVPHPQDSFAGNCPFHGNCLEGLAAGPAIEKRHGIKGQALSPDASFWEWEADYLAQCAYNTTLLFSPEIIIFGGGVMKVPGLIEKIRRHFSERLQGYVKVPPLDSYLVTPKLADNAGTLGCLALARELSLQSGNGDS